MDGENPMVHDPAYRSLWTEASRLTQHPNQAVGKVGEDSAFFDLLHAHGFRAAVDTNLVAGHTVVKQISPQDMIDCFNRSNDHMLASLGVLR